MNNNPDNAWKAVGSPSRRGSTTASAMAHFLAEQTSNSSKISPNESPVNDHVDIIRRSSIVSESGNQANWGSFGGFQWEGPSIFDEENNKQQQAVAPDDNSQYDSILSVPMLPGVSLEPIYRQQRSLSFSMGQDPTFFGYDDYEDNTTPTTLPPNQYLKQPTFNSSLAPMEEEEMEDNYFSEYDLAQFRSRSKSSGAAFGLLSQNQHARLLNNGHIRRGSEQQDDLLINQQRRRSSSRFFNLPETTTAGQQQQQQMSLGDKEQYLRRLSQQQQDYSFPPNNNNAATAVTDPTGNYNMMRRQSLTLNTQPPSNIQQLADQLENTHLRSEIAFPPPPPPSMHQQQYIYMQQQQQSQYQHPASTTTNSSSYLQHLQQQQPYHQHHHYTQQLQAQAQAQQQAQQHNQQVQQQVADDYFDTDSRGYQDLGKGIPLSRLDPKLPLYMVEFKGGRTDFFYVLDSNQFHPQLGDLVIVEADRGKDLGKVAANTLTIDQVSLLEQKKQAQLQQLENNEKEKQAAANAEKNGGGEEETAVQQTPKQQREIHIKRIFRLATPDEINLLLVKGQDEHKALVVCQQKTKQRKLPMEVVDAEYQWDRRKLTFYFEAENRIDFRELVRELFKIYKTRIWM